MQKGEDETIVALMTRRTGECDLGAVRLHVLHDGDGLWRLLGCTHRRVLHTTSQHNHSDTQRDNTCKHQQDLALCHDVTVDSMTCWWVPVKHPQCTGARTREGCEGHTHRARTMLHQTTAHFNMSHRVRPRRLALPSRRGSGASLQNHGTRPPARSASVNPALHQSTHMSPPTLTCKHCDSWRVRPDSQSPKCPAQVAWTQSRVQE